MKEVFHQFYGNGTICNVKAVESESGVGLVAENDAVDESELIKLPLPQCISTIDGQTQEIFKIRQFFVLSKDKKN